MITGQDESEVAQYLLSSNQWIGPKGQVPLLPKLERDGYMLSAFVSHEFGFGRKMTEDELAKVNMARQMTALGGGSYRDTTTAMEIKKAEFERVSFSEIVLVHWHQQQGILELIHMVLQLEDVLVDCVQVLNPMFYLVFLFDHSHGHAHKRDSALSVLRMSIH